MSHSHPHLETTLYEQDKRAKVGSLQTKQCFFCKSGSMDWESTFTSGTGRVKSIQLFFHKFTPYVVTFRASFLNAQSALLWR